MSEPTPQEIRLAALLHEADGVDAAWLCPATVACDGRADTEHIAQARALIALGVRVDVEPPMAGTHTTTALRTLADADWRDAR